MNMAGRGDGLQRLSLPRPAWLRREVPILVFLLPTFILLAIFIYLPAGIAMVTSLFDWQPGIRLDWVGLLNFRRILSDPLFWESWRNVAIIAVWTFTIPFVIPLAVAEAIFNLRSTRAQAVYRVLILIPILIPATVTLSLWKWLYAFPDGGLNSILSAAGLGEFVTSWLGTPLTAFAAVLMFGFPWFVGLAPLIYLAGLNNIPNEIIDASKIDGASTWQRIRHIDVPSILGQVRLLVIVGIIALIQGFGTQLVLTAGGPAGSTFVPGLYLYDKAFGIDRASQMQPEMGQASAVGVVMFVTIVGLSVLAFRRLRIRGLDGDAP